MLRQTRRLIVCGALGLLGAAPFAAAQAPASTAPALILTNAKIVTLDAKSSIAQAVAVKDGKIVAVGSAAEIGRLAGAGTKVLDLAGRTVLPGLDDSHVHLSGIGAATFTDAQVGDARSIAELLQIIKDAVALKKPGEWVTVSGDLRSTRIKEARYPTRAELDSVAPNNPVLVPTGHRSTANSAALKLAGIGKNTPNPPGGVIHKDANGEPNGALDERAAALVSSIIPEREVETGQAILNAQHMLAKLGFTSFRETGVTPDVFEAYKKLDAEKKLILRSSVLIRARDASPATLEAIKSWSQEIGKGSDMLSFWGIKLQIDGGLSLTNGALLKEPYLDQPGFHGVQTISSEDFFKLASAANKVGISVAVHASGDQGIETALEAYAKASAEKDIRGHRWAIEHDALATPKAIAIMRDLGVVASVQPSNFSNAPLATINKLGPERMRRFIPLRSFLNAGVVVAGGSDAPAMDLNPYHGLWAAVTRTLRATNSVIEPGQRLSREEALRIYMQGGAYLTFEEAKKGSIEPGKFADFTVISDDIMTIEENKIQDITAVMTIVGGDVIYDALASGGAK